MATHTQLYTSLIPIITKIARQHGYALAVHGSLQKDLDLIAVPWVEEAKNAQELAEAIKNAVNGQILPAYHPSDPKNRNPSHKPHGRIVYTIILKEGHNPAYIDLSITPLQPAPKPTPPPKPAKYIPFDDDYDPMDSGVERY